MTSSTVYDPKKGTRSYVLKAACVSTRPEATVPYQVVDVSADNRRSKAERWIQGGQITCDGSTTHDDIGPLGGLPVSVELDLGDQNVVTAYALVVPAAD
jgi:hypothetical protein